MTTSSHFPDLNSVAYPVDSPGDHADGGHCVGFYQAEAPEAWCMLTYQFHQSLKHLVALATVSGGDSQLTRPMLFNAHHTVEVGCKASLVARSEPFNLIHSLPELWKMNALAAVEATWIDGETSAWMEDFTERLDDLSGSGIGARFAEPKSGFDAIENAWCCVNATALLECVDFFVATLRGFVPELDAAYVQPIFNDFLGDQLDPALRPAPDGSTG